MLEIETVPDVDPDEMEGCVNGLTELALVLLIIFS